MAEIKAFRKTRNPPDPTQVALARQVIDRLGGTLAVAELCECKPPSVSEWKQYGIPKARQQFLRLLRPDAFRARRGRRQ